MVGGVPGGGHGEGACVAGDVHGEHAWWGHAW